MFSLWCSMWGRVLRMNNAACSALCQVSVISTTTHKQIGLFWCWFMSGYVCVHTRTLWVSPVNCPVRLRVSPTASTLTGVFSQRSWGFISLHWNPGLCGLSHSPVVPPLLSACTCRITQCSSCHLDCPCPPADTLLQVICQSVSLLPIWMNVSTLTPCLWDFLTVRFSVSSECFCF